jgi:hypothetical protein
MVVGGGQAGRGEECQGPKEKEEERGLLAERTQTEMGCGGHPKSVHAKAVLGAAKAFLRRLLLSSSVRADLPKKVAGDR